MDELSGDSLTSSMVDYVFFVLQQSSQRAVEAHNIYGLCATLNHTVKCLDNYKEVCSLPPGVFSPLADIDL